MALLFASHHHWTIFAGFSECMSWNGRGERNWTSVPTLSRLFARWFFTRFDIASSVTFALPLPWAPLLDSNPDLYAYRDGGALVCPWISMIIVALLLVCGRPCPDEAMIP